MQEKKKSGGGEKKKKMEVVSENVIPKIIWQTWKVKTNFGPGMQKAVDSIDTLNPDYEHRICDDQDCEDYVREHFEPEVLEAYQTLVPKAFKADLWRYCVLYREGGVYMDIDFVAQVPLSEILRPDDVFVSVKDRAKLVGESAVYQAFIACVPQLPAMKHVIDFCVRNVLKRASPTSCLAVTGPIAFGDAINEYRKKANAPLWLGDNKVKDVTLRLLVFSDDGGAVLDKPEGRELFWSKFPEYYQEGAVHYGGVEYYTSSTPSVQKVGASQAVTTPSNTTTTVDEWLVWVILSIAWVLLIILVVYVRYKYKHNQKATISKSDHPQT